MKKLFSTNYSDNAFNIGIFLLRVTAGPAMGINWGYFKLTHFSALSANFPNPYHLPSSVAAGLLVFAEFFCALMIVLGLLTRFAAFALVIAMGTAFFHAHGGQLFHKVSANGFYTYPNVVPALFLVIFFLILLVGPGKFSVDKLIGK